MAQSHPILHPHQVDQACAAFHRDGFAVIGDALTEEQLAYARQGTERVMGRNSGPDGTGGGRGGRRYTFGNQADQPQWLILIDLPTTRSLLDAIFGDSQYGYTVVRVGGDYSLPGAADQELHVHQEADFRHLPPGVAPLVVVSFPMVDFTSKTGATRIIAGTQRTMEPPPALQDEPQWMKDSHVFAPAGSAIVWDSRLWHAGSANRSDQKRAYMAVYYAQHWYRPYDEADEKCLPRQLYETLSPWAQQVCRYMVRN